MRLKQTKWVNNNEIPRLKIFYISVVLWFLMTRVIVSGCLAKIAPRNEFLLSRSSPEPLISLDLVSTKLYFFRARVHCYYCLYIIFSMCFVKSFFTIWAFVPWISMFFIKKKLVIFRVNRAASNEDRGKIKVGLYITTRKIHFKVVNIEHVTWVAFYLTLINPLMGQGMLRPSNCHS